MGSGSRRRSSRRRVGTGGKVSASVSWRGRRETGYRHTQWPATPMSVGTTPRRPASGVSTTARRSRARPCPPMAASPGLGSPRLSLRVFLVVGSPCPHAGRRSGGSQADPAAFPSLAKTIAHLTPDSFDDRFVHGVDLTLSGHSAVRADRTGPHRGACHRFAGGRLGGCGASPRLGRIATADRERSTSWPGPTRRAVMLGVRWPPKPRGRRPTPAVRSFGRAGGSSGTPHSSHSGGWASRPRRTYGMTPPWRK